MRERHYNAIAEALGTAWAKVNPDSSGHMSVLVSAVSDTFAQASEWFDRKKFLDAVSDAADKNRKPYKQR